MATRKKKPSAALAPNPDPTTPLDGAALVAALQPVRKALEEDLLTRATKSPALHAALTRRHAEEQEQERTADPFPVWRRAYVEQVAAAWILSVVFVRTLEDRGLLAENRIAGPGAADAQRTFLELAPSLSEREYLLTVFREMSRLPAAAALFDHHDLAWSLAPSADGAKALLQFFRAPDPEAPAFRFGQRRVTHSSPDTEAHTAKAHDAQAHVSKDLTATAHVVAPAPSGLHDDTRFLGDLYQDLNENVRKRYALLQTPDFVEAFLLDRTLEPAIERFGLPDTTLIDPTCGSGHFLLGAFHRLVERHRHHAPGISARDAALRALDAVHGTDINPYAVAIAKFRLTLAFLDVAGFRRLADAPALPLHVAVADSLLYNPQHEQRELFHQEGVEVRDWDARALGFEDPEEARAILGRQFAAVVGNPPYIVVSDPVLRERYRKAYPSASGKYSLSVPFCERFFQLAKKGGFVGQITSNSFMKREFGKKLIESFFPNVDLQLIVNTAGAYIPGHGTPTVILVGSPEAPTSPKVRGVLAKRGEPSTPDDPAQGQVWQSIVRHWDDLGFENDFVSIADVSRDELRKHPWSLAGGGAGDLKALLEERAEKRLSDITTSIGIASFTLEDDVYLRPSDSWARAGVSPPRLRPMIIGEAVRDWSIGDVPFAFFPYSDQFEPVSDDSSDLRPLWPWRTNLANNMLFGGKTKVQGGLRWHEYGRLTTDKLRTPLTITFAEVATHNHFVLDRGGKVFKQTAPIIKLPETATEEDHLALLAYLNSSTVAFFLRQVAHQKQMMGADSIRHTDPTTVTFAFNATSIGLIPVPSFTNDNRTRLAILAQRCLDLASTIENMLGRSALESWISSAITFSDHLSKIETHADRLQSELCALQEDIDWLVYGIVELAPPNTYESPTPATVPGARAFERAMHAAGVAQTVNGHTTFPADATDALLAARLDAIALSPMLRSLEQTVFKRRWIGRQGKFNRLVATRSETWERVLSDEVLDAAELSFGASQARRVSEMRSAISARSPEALLAIDSLGIPQDERIAGWIGAEAVPFLAAYRYTDTGLEKRAQWEETWDLQRREDAGEKIPNIPVPPRYDAKDFPSATYWRLRGKLDVPKERFISYPGCESDEDGEPLYGWAGWNHAERAEALVALYQDRKTRESWPKERLLPLLAGLLELLPWLHQWHDEPHPDYDTTIAEAYRAFLQTELRTHDLTEEDLRTWRPSGKSGGKKAGKKPAKTARKSRSPQALEDVSASTSDERADE